MQRRTLLATLGATGVALAAGCLSNAPQSQPEPSPPTSPTSNPKATTVPTNKEPDVTPEIHRRTIETRDTTCMGATGASVTVSFEDDRIAINGVAQTSTPCHEAVVESAVVENGEVILQVGFQPVGEQCIDCVGAIEYVANLEMTRIDGIDSVTVIHSDSGKRFTHTRGRETSAGTSPTNHTPDTPTEPASQQPDPDLDVILTNADDKSHEFAITIRRESGNTVYETTQEVPADSRLQIYNLTAADPDGIEAFTIAVVVGEQAEEITVKTNACYGNAIIEVTADGELYPYYSIC